MYKKDVQKSNNAEVGDCLIMPGRFKGYCESKFGIKGISTPHYGEHSGMQGEISDGSPYSYYHEVNVFDRKIVIDWTVSQYKNYRGEEFYPYVYEVGDKDAFNGGVLYEEFGINQKFI